MSYSEQFLSALQTVSYYYTLLLLVPYLHQPLEVPLKYHYLGPKKGYISILK